MRSKMAGRNMFLAHTLPTAAVVLFLVAGLHLSDRALRAGTVPDDPIPAPRAFDAGCDAFDLSDSIDEARYNPEWAPIIHDSAYPFPTAPPTILEGTVPAHPGERSRDQAPSEVAEEDLPWNHYTHDQTFKVVPDVGYKHLLSSWLNADGSTGVHEDMEVEWESASAMDDNRTWGAVPEFVWPAVGDRVWVEGRWIFDCGHPGAADRDHVQYSTEIHPPRAQVTFRLNHLALSTLVPALPPSWLPVTGEPAVLAPDTPNSGPTQVPVTEADVFVSGNGGGANDLCISLNSDSCTHTGPLLPVNDANYVFDIYPPGTNYGVFLANNTFEVTPPTDDASLQWRIIPQWTQIPGHACGRLTTDCVTVTPTFCLIDASTPPPDQTETGCPAVPAAHPTRVRVILPFAGSNANVFAQTILLGWDDVPRPATNSHEVGDRVRTFRVSLHKFTVVNNGESFVHDGDWRVFVGVGGEWRYVSPLFDRNGDGDNVCNGDALTENGDDDCFQFDQTPWTVSILNGDPIHVAVGGFESDQVDSDFCRHFLGCDYSFGKKIRLALFNDDRIGTYEFDLQWPDYAAPMRFRTNPVFTSGDLFFSGDGTSYEVEFHVEEVAAATPPASNALAVGTPHYGQYVSSATSLSLSTGSADARGFQYRFRQPGSPLPTYASALPFPVHWTQADLQSGSQSLPLSLNGADGPYLLQYSAESFANLLEPRHTESLTLDNTPPAIAVVQPQATAYPHSATLTLNYSADDGAGSGVRGFTPLMDGADSLHGHGLQSGQPINLLTEMTLGSHTFTVMASDNVDNTATSTVTFTIVVTPESIKDDVRQFLQGGAIKNGGLANSLLAKLNAAANQRAKGNCGAAGNIYQAFISELQAQSGKGVDAAAAAIMIADAQYLIDHC